MRTPVKAPEGKEEVSSWGTEVSMTNMGKEVEALVRDIEQQFLPQGFKVEPRQRLYDEAGEQIAELDIVISGALGSSGVKWLIECRDRPSAGPAPVSWIEQLVGRRERFQFDRVFAVSTTGFSSAAKDFAKTKNVILRTVTRINEIKSDFMIQNLSMHFQGMEFAGPIDLQTADPQYKRNIDIRRPMFKRPAETEFLHMPVFVFRNPEHIHLIDEASGLVLFRYDDWLDLKAGDEIMRVHLLRAPLKINTNVKTFQAVLATIYAEDGKPLWLEGEFEADTPKGKVKTRIQVFNYPNGTQSIKVLNDQMPDGYFPDAFSVYGRN
jgi:hypothetical protein